MDLAKSLNQFNIVKGVGGEVDLTLPVCMWVANTLLRLRLTPYGEGYIVCCNDNLFTEANDTQERYFNIFKKHNPDDCFGMKVKCDIIYKEYQENYNPVVAVDEFVRFFVKFDDFICPVIGHEEDYD